MSTATTEPIFVRIGGHPAVAATVDGLYERILADDTLAPTFAGLGRSS